VVLAAAKRLATGGGRGGGGLSSFRGEALERVSIVVAEAGASEAGPGQSITFQLNCRLICP
jgi:hypothetical protein